jgi:ubiquinone/menaquinone biosynthesis C-methylase UbiE
MSSIPAGPTELTRAPAASDHLLLSNQRLRDLSTADPSLSVRHAAAPPFDVIERTVRGFERRWARERRRRKVGRAYDMAREIARVLPHGSEVLDVGCGNGFIAHHLSAMLGASVVGIDLETSAGAPIDYRRYNGAQFPVMDESFDAVLFCYVLHHAQNVSVTLNEMRRVLREGGRAIIYEDIPGTWWDRGVCCWHNLLWKRRTGSCSFRNESEWRALFESLGFEIISERRLSRWRNLTHPVSRRFYVLRKARFIGLARRVIRPAL